MDVDVAAQLVANALISGGAFAMVGFGFGLVLYTCRFFHMAHGSILILAPYLVLALGQHGVPAALCVGVAVAAAILVGVLVELCVYRPLRARDATSTAMLLGSLGVLIVLQNAVSLFFGDDVRTIEAGGESAGRLILGARLTPVQLVALAYTFVSWIGLALFMKKTHWGWQMRAVAADQELAMVSGVRTQNVFLGAIGLASALGALAAILVAYDTGFTPASGFQVLLMGIVASILGGIGNVHGTMVGGLMLGFVRELGGWYLAANWQYAFAFVALILTLLLRPQGLFGGRTSRLAS